MNEEIYLKWLKKTNNLELLIRASRRYFGVEEEWRDVVGYEGFYKISNFGRIKSIEKTVTRGVHDYRLKEIVLVLNKSSCGYLCVSLCKKGISASTRVNRIVANAFIPNTENKPQVNHENSIKIDNRDKNLTWMTARENVKHSFRTGTRKTYSHWTGITGGQNPNSKSVVRLTKEGMFIEKYESITKAEAATCIDHRNISSVCVGKRKTAGGYMWKHAD